MKRLVLVALCAATAACRVDMHRAGGPAPTDFYGELARHGDWVTLAPYGTVWQPAQKEVGPGFYPYFTGGHWVNNEHGWSWQSAWSWGWIVFHHGRWVASSEHGWVWLPGDEWAPAWVEWRVGDGLVGWVPLGPQGVSTALPGYRPRWCFMPMPQFSSPSFHSARLPAHREYAAYHRATGIPFKRGDGWRGPSVELIRRAGGDVTRADLQPPRSLRRGDVRAEQRVRPWFARASESRTPHGEVPGVRAIDAGIGDEPVP